MDTTQPTPSTPKKGIRPLWILIGFCVAALALLTCCGIISTAMYFIPVPSVTANDGPAVSVAPQAPEEAPAAQGENSTKVDDNVVKVFSEGKLIAEVTFVTTVDNMPTEWLRDREGVLYLYQSGIGNKVDLKVTLYDGGSFAIDGDWMVYGGADLGKINDSADFRAFADKPGTYTFSASSFGLAVGPYRANDDKAGFVLADRRSADNGDHRPEYWLDPTGKPVEIGQ